MLIEADFYELVFKKIDKNSLYSIKKIEDFMSIKSEKIEISSILLNDNLKINGETIFNNREVTYLSKENNSLDENYIYLSNEEKIFEKLNYLFSSDVVVALINVFNVNIKNIMFKSIKSIEAETIDISYETAEYISSPLITKLFINGDKINLDSKKMMLFNNIKKNKQISSSLIFISNDDCSHFIEKKMRL